MARVPIVTDTPPVANAGPNQTVALGTTVQLDGSQSHDVDGDVLSFYWALTAAPVGSLATLSDLTAVQPTFVADLPGTYVGQLIVNDGQVDSTPATTTITAEAITPPPSINQASLTVGPVTNGQVTIMGAIGSVAGGAQVTITNTRTGQMATVTATADGSFTATITARSGDTLSFITTDAAGHASAPTTVTIGGFILDRTVATDLASATAFLYTGNQPIQTGVAAGTIEPRRAAVLRGQVRTRSGRWRSWTAAGTSWPASSMPAQPMCPTIWKRGGHLPYPLRPSGQSPTRH